MSKFTDDDIRKLAMLSRLRLTDAEITQYKQELSAILDYVEILQNVDIKGIKPTSQVTGLVNVVRDDEPINYGVSSEDLMANAPEIQDHMFKVKRMIG
jgi:aspartyl-tRNA(Asn)/glutamyl-tRNA(Gln) amidotransferase subunit C